MPPNTLVSTPQKTGHKRRRHSTDDLPHNPPDKALHKRRRRSADDLPPNPPENAIHLRRRHSTHDLHGMFLRMRLGGPIQRQDPVTSEMEGLVSYADTAMDLDLEVNYPPSPSTRELEDLVEMDFDWDVTTPNDAMLREAPNPSPLVTGTTDMPANLDAALSLGAGQLSAREHDYWKRQFDDGDVEMESVVTVTSSIEATAATTVHTSTTSPEDAAESSERSNKRKRYVNRT